MGTLSKFKPRAIRRSAADRHRLQREFEARVHEADRERRAACEQGQHGSHKRRDCPNMPCTSCKKDGHAAPTCPTLRTRTRHILATPTSIKQTPRSLLATLPISQERSWQPMTKEILPCYYCPGMSSIDAKNEEQTVSSDI